MGATFEPIPDRTSGEEGESLAARAVRRRLGERRTSAESEVRRLLDVGLALMREDPDADVRIADITRRAEVSNDAFYRAFRGKSELMAAIADEGARRLRGYVQHQMEKADGPAEQVRACVRAVLAQVVDGEVAATSRAVLRHVPRTVEGRTSGAAHLSDEIARLLAEPLRALGSAEPEADALVAACAVVGFMEHFLWTGRRPTPAQIEGVTGWVVRGASGPV